MKFFFSERTFFNFLRKRDERVAASHNEMISVLRCRLQDDKQRCEYFKRVTKQNDSLVEELDIVREKLAVSNLDNEYLQDCKNTQLLQLNAVHIRHRDQLDIQHGLIEALKRQVIELQAANKEVDYLKAGARSYEAAFQSLSKRHESDIDDLMEKAQAYGDHINSECQVEIDRLTEENDKLLFGFHYYKNLVDIFQDIIKGEKHESVDIRVSSGADSSPEGDCEVPGRVHNGALHEPRSHRKRAGTTSNKPRKSGRTPRVS